MVAAVVVPVREALEGEPTPKFHTLRTIDLAEDRKPKRGVALPLSARMNLLVVALLPSAGEGDERNILLVACGPAMLVPPCLLLLRISFFAWSIFRVAALSLSTCFSSVWVFMGEMVSRRPLSFPQSSSRTLTRFDIRLSASSCTSSTTSSSSSNPPGIPIRWREVVLMTRVPALDRFPAGPCPCPRTSDLRFFEPGAPRLAA